MPDGQTYTATDPSGKRIRFKWKGTIPPTESDLQQVFARHEAHKATRQIERETQKEIGQIPGGRFAQEHPILSSVIGKAQEFLERPLLPDVAPPTPEQRELEQYHPLFGAARDVYKHLVQPVSTPANIGLAAGTAVAPEVTLPYFAYSGTEQALTSGQEIPGAVQEYMQNPSEESRERLKQTIYGTAGGAATALAAGAGAASLKPRVGARMPEVLPPDYPVPSRGTAEPLGLPPKPTEQLPSVTQPQLAEPQQFMAPTEGPAEIGPQPDISGVYGAPSFGDTSVQYPYRMPSSTIEPYLDAAELRESLRGRQVPTGRHPYVDLFKGMERTGMYRYPTVEEQYGLPEVRSVEQPPTAAIPPEQITPTVAPPAEQVAPSKPSILEPIPPGYGPASIKPELPTPKVEAPETPEQLAARFQAEMEDAKPAEIVKPTEVGPGETKPEIPPIKADEITKGFDKRGTGELKLLRTIYGRSGQTRIVKAIDDELSKRTGKYKVLPPEGEPERPFEFGRTLEGVRPEEALPKEELVEPETPASLSQLLRDESGALNAKKIVDWFKGNSDVGDDLDYIKVLRYKLASGQKLNPEESQYYQANKAAIMQIESTDPKLPAGRLARVVRSINTAQRIIERNEWVAPVSDALIGDPEGKLGGRTGLFGEIPKNIYRAKQWGAVKEIFGQRPLTPAEDKNIGDILEKYPGEVPSIDPNFTNREMDIAHGIRALTDSIWEDAHAADVRTKAGKPMGRIENYFPHMMADPSIPEELWDSLAAIFSGEAEPKLFPTLGKLLKYKKAIPVSEQGYTEQVSAKPGGIPQFGAVEPRTGTEFTQERRISKVLRRYIEGMARYKYDKPAILKAREVLKRVPDSFEKDLSTWLVQHYGKFDALPELEGALKHLDRQLAGTGARSVLFGNTRVQFLHLVRGFIQGLPEVGPTNWAVGVAKTLMNPRQAIRKIRNAGLAPYQVIPRQFRSVSEDLNILGNYADTGNQIAKAIMLNANEAKYGHGYKAINETAKAEGLVTPARASYILEEWPKIFTQFKYWAVKYGENAAYAITDAINEPTRQNWQRVAYYILTATAAIELAKATGMTFWHARLSLLEVGASPAVAMWKRVIGKIAKGDIAGAAGEYAKYKIPGGQAIPRELGAGPTFVEQEKRKGGPHKVSKPRKLQLAR